MKEIAEMSLIDRLREFLETEARSGSMDFGCVTPLYVYRSWGCTVAIDKIDKALNYLKANNYGY
jgi:hypothetical protein